MSKITIFGYNISLEFLILVGVIYLIIIIHTVCSCCNMKQLMESMGSMGSPSEAQYKKFSNSTNLPTQTTSGGGVMASPVGLLKEKEGFVGANTNYGESSNFDLNVDKPINTSSWFAQDMVVTPGKPLSKGVQEVFNRPSQPIPLPKDELLLFANTPFKPECCPNTYSTSSGCACMTVEQYNWIKLRGGNNTPYSEY